MNISQNIRFRTLTIAVLLGLVANAMWTVPALADSGTTNPPAPTSGTGSTRGSHSSSNNLSGVPGGTKVVIVDSQGDKLALGSQQAQDILNSGDPVWCPATLAAPTPGLGGCTGSQPDLATLFGTFTAVSPSMNGTIWIEQTPPSESAPASLSGSGLAMANFTLTLKGGWNGMSGTPGTTTFSGGISITHWNNNIALSNITVDGASGVGLSITTSKNITLTNVQSNDSSGGGGDGADLNTTYNSGTGSVSITGGQFDHNNGYGAQINLGTGGTLTISGTHFDDNQVSDGLSVTSSGAVTLTNVTADSNVSGGAYIDNSAAASATVTVNGTGNDFSSNYDDGLNVTSKGVVTLTNVTATGNGNFGYGVHINNMPSTTHAGVNLTGGNVFDNNWFGGLLVTSNGAITANDLTASGNGVTTSYDGAALENDSSSAIGGVTFTGMNVFDGNGGNGLTIESYGAIKVNNLIAFHNHDAGAAIVNEYSIGPTLVVQPVTFTGSSQFNDNDYGLQVSSNGLITANNITAISNGASGANFQNNYVGAKAGITLTGINAFNNNQVQGIILESNGPMKLNSITANGNDLSHASLYYGADIENTLYGTSASTVTLTGVNTFNGNYDTDLVIWSVGAVNASSITANNSQTAWGTQITAKGAVTLTGTNTFNFNAGDGLTIDSQGAITTNNLIATGNTQEGVDLDNCRNLGSGCTYSTTKPITMNGTNTFNSNHDTGLRIDAMTAVTANNLNANCNGFSGTCGSVGVVSYGVMVDNCQMNSSCTGGGPIKLTGSSTLDNNYMGGLYIASPGAIALNSITASFNYHADGLNVENTDSGSSSPQSITLTGTNVFNDNANIGASLESYGKITASNVTADWNAEIGLQLDNLVGNYTARPAQAVMLNGVNALLGNVGDGLYVTASGAISISNLMEDGAGASNGEGIVLQNNNISGNTGAVILTDVSASNNYSSGFSVDTAGAVTGTTLTADGNGTGSAGEGGANFEGSGSSTSLIFKGNNTFDDNLNGEGLSVDFSSGSITINNNLQASGNHSYGAELDTSTASIKLTGTGVFQNNYFSGLYVFSSGIITTNNLTATGNGVHNSAGYGVDLENTGGPVQNITMTGTNIFNGNYDGGLNVQSKGNISVNNVTANNNGNGSDNGVTLRNNGSGGVGSVTLTGTNTFNGNYNAGLAVYTTGAIMASNLNANSNGRLTGDAGAYFDAGSGTITLTGVNAFSNNGKSGTGGGGMFINNAGIVNLTSVTAENNAYDGLGGITTGNVTLTCGSFNSNGQYGLNMTVGGSTLKLIGVTAAGNSLGQINASVTPVTVRDCPLP